MSKTSIVVPKDQNIKNENTPNEQLASVQNTLDRILTEVSLARLEKQKRSEAKQRTPAGTTNSIKDTPSEDKNKTTSNTASSSSAKATTANKSSTSKKSPLQSMVSPEVKGGFGGLTDFFLTAATGGILNPFVLKAFNVKGMLGTLAGNIKKRMTDNKNATLQRLASDKASETSKTLETPLTSTTKNDEVKPVELKNNLTNGVLKNKDEDKPLTTKNDEYAKQSTYSDVQKPLVDQSVLPADPTEREDGDVDGKTNSIRDRSGEEEILSNIFGLLEDHFEKDKKDSTSTDKDEKDEDSDTGNGIMSALLTGLAGVAAKVKSVAGFIGTILSPLKSVVKLAKGLVSLITGAGKGLAGLITKGAKLFAKGLPVAASLTSLWQSGKEIYDMVTDKDGTYEAKLNTEEWSLKHVLNPSRAAAKAGGWIADKFTSLFETDEQTAKRREAEAKANQEILRRAKEKEDLKLKQENESIASAGNKAPEKYDNSSSENIEDSTNDILFEGIESQNSLENSYNELLAAQLECNRILKENLDVNKNKPVAQTIEKREMPKKADVGK
jgi:hypothetical protein